MTQMIATYTTADQVRGALAAGLLTSGVLSKFSGDAQAVGPRPYDISTVRVGFNMDQLVAGLETGASWLAGAAETVWRHLASSHRMKGLAALAFGILGASLAIAAAADLGASAALRPNHGSVGSLPVLVVQAETAII